MRFLILLALPLLLPAAAARSEETVLLLRPADFVAVEGDPTLDIAALGRVRLVVKRSRIVR